MAKLLWYSLQRRNHVWAGLGKTFLLFLPSHPLQAICSLFLLNIMPVQMVCFASWAQGSFFNNKGQVGNLLVTPKMVGHGFHPVLRSEIPLEMWCKPWSLTEMYHPTLEFSLLTLCCHFQEFIAKELWWSPGKLLDKHGIAKLAKEELRTVSEVSHGCRCCREIIDALSFRHGLKYWLFWKFECYYLFKRSHLMTIVET